jgi:hypothetical protein
VLSNSTCMHLCWQHHFSTVALAMELCNTPQALVDGQAGDTLSVWILLSRSNKRSLSEVMFSFV